MEAFSLAWISAVCCCSLTDLRAESLNGLHSVLTAGFLGTFVLVRLGYGGRREEGEKGENLHIGCV